MIFDCRKLTCDGAVSTPERPRQRDSQRLAGKGGGVGYLDAELPEVTLCYALVEVSEVETVSDLLHMLTNACAGSEQNTL